MFTVFTSKKDEHDKIEQETIRVYNLTKAGKKGKYYYTINFYLTTSKIMANGEELSKFLAVDYPVFEKIVIDKYNYNDEQSLKSIINLNEPICEKVEDLAIMGNSVVAPISGVVVALTDSTIPVDNKYSSFYNDNKSTQISEIVVSVSTDSAIIVNKEGSSVCNELSNKLSKVAVGDQQKSVICVMSSNNVGKYPVVNDPVCVVAVGDSATPANEEDSSACSDLYIPLNPLNGVIVSDQQIAVMSSNGVDPVSETIFGDSTDSTIPVNKKDSFTINDFSGDDSVSAGQETSVKEFAESSSNSKSFENSNNASNPSENINLIDTDLLDYSYVMFEDDFDSDYDMDGMLTSPSKKLSKKKKRKSFVHKDVINKKLNSIVTSLRQMNVAAITNSNKVSESQDEILEKIKAKDENFSELETKVNKIKTSNFVTKTVMDSEINILKTENNTLNTKVNNLQTKIGTMNTSVENNFVTKTVMDSEINILKAENNTLNTKVNNLQTEIGTMNTSLKSLETAYGNVQAEKIKIIKDITTLKQDISALDGKTQTIHDDK